MGKHHHCKKLKCTEKHIISCLPYHIYESGQYCLGKDFTWTDSTKSAITINADNVVLDFNQRTITSSVASSFPLISANGSNDLVLNNVHLKTTGDAAYSIDGIDVRDCAALTVNSPRLINLRVGLYTESVKGVEIHHLYLENEDPESSYTVPLLIYLCDDIKLYDSVVENARTYFGSAVNADIQRLQAHNRGNGRALQFASTPIEDKFFGTGPSPRTTTNVKVSGCELISDNNIGLFAFGSGSGEFEYTNQDFLIENNFIQGANIGLLLQYFYSGALIKCNQIRQTNRDFSAGIEVFGGEGIRIQDNNISTFSNPFILEVSGNIGLLMAGNEIFLCRYNFIDNNTVTGAGLGFNDGAIIGVPSACNIFRDNMATGNQINYDFDLTLGTVDHHNIRGCTVPTPEPMVLSAEKSSESGKNLLYHEN